MHPHQTLLAGPEYTGRKSPHKSYLKFHIIRTPKNSNGKLVPTWVYESTTIEDIYSEERLIALVCLGKIVSPIEHLDSLLAQVPIYQVDDPEQESAKRFKDTTWVASGFNMLSNKVHISHAAALTSTEELECKSQAFIQAHGRWGPKSYNQGDIPVLDLMCSKERSV
jgi:hypothetical protein